MRKNWILVNLVLLCLFLLNNNIGKDLALAKGLNTRGKYVPPSPELIEPPNDAYVGEGPIILKWRAKGWGHGFQIEVANNPNFDRSRVIQIQITGDGYKEGDIYFERIGGVEGHLNYWRVRGFVMDDYHREHYGGWSAPSCYIIRLRRPEHVGEPAGLPDLVITNIYCSEKNLAFEVKNQGSGYFGKSAIGKYRTNVKVWISPPGNENIISLDSLSEVNKTGEGVTHPGGSSSFLTSIEIGTESFVELTIDPDNRIRESNENNNIYGRRIGPCSKIIRLPKSIPNVIPK